MLPKSGPLFLSKHSSPEAGTEASSPQGGSSIKASLSALPLSTDHGQGDFVVAYIISDIWV